LGGGAALWLNLSDRQSQKELHEATPFVQFNCSADTKRRFADLQFAKSLADVWLYPLARVTAGYRVSQAVFLQTGHTQDRNKH
jgi:hypothetical protein